MRNKDKKAGRSEEDPQNLYKRLLARYEALGEELLEVEKRILDIEQRYSFNEQWRRDEDDEYGYM